MFFCTLRTVDHDALPDCHNSLAREAEAYNLLSLPFIRYHNDERNAALASAAHSEGVVRDSLAQLNHRGAALRNLLLAITPTMRALAFVAVPRQHVVVQYQLDLRHRRVERHCCTHQRRLIRASGMSVVSCSTTRASRILEPSLQE